MPSNWRPGRDQSIASLAGDLSTLPVTWIVNAVRTICPLVRFPRLRGKEISMSLLPLVRMPWITRSTGAGNFISICRRGETTRTPLADAPRWTFVSKKPVVVRDTGLPATGVGAIN